MKGQKMDKKSLHIILMGMHCKMRTPSNRTKTSCIFHVEELTRVSLSPHLLVPPFMLVEPCSKRGKMLSCQTEARVQL